MKNVTRVALLIAALLFVASLATCYFGVEYEISKLPPEHPAHTGDDDWIGFEWVIRAMTLQAVAFFAALIALVAWNLGRKRAGVKGVSR